MNRQLIEWAVIVLLIAIMFASLFVTVRNGDKQAAARAGCLTPACDETTPVTKSDQLTGRGQIE